MTQFPFVQLPKEIKDMVYGQCLVSEQKIIPFVTWYEHDDGLEPSSKSKNKPDLALLAVINSIRVEAAEILWSKNVFHLNSGPGFIPKGIHWEPNIHLVRHICLTLDARDLRPQVSVGIFESALEEATHNTQNVASLIASIHNERRYTLIDSWVSKCKQLAGMKLRSLEIDVTNANCPGGCCRFAKACLHHMILGQWHRREHGSLCYCLRGWGEPMEADLLDLAGMRITVVGIKDETEADEIHKMGFGCKKCPLVGKVLDIKACTRDRN